MPQNFTNIIKSYFDLSDIKVILDIGSRDALEGVSFSKLHPGAKVYSFEPNPEAFNDCLFNAFNYPNVKCINKALYNKNERITFRPMDLEKSPDKNIGASSIFEVDQTVQLPNNWKWVQREIEVEAQRLDDWVVENGIDKVDLIWMDCQGAEGLILEGAVNTLKNVRAIYTETGMIPYYKGQTLLPQINEFLVKNNFALVRFLPEMPLECSCVFINKAFWK